LINKAQVQTKGSNWVRFDTPSVSPFSGAAETVARSQASHTTSYGAKRAMAFKLDRHVRRCGLCS
ncbi:hypothetical protein AB0I46_41060, partial [Streptomyces spectabilis]|uniref:hypothetical protein n=1 Tax=Streptomyces spectabilis TaxID=68270 RepID=UPI0033CEC181